MEFHAEIEKEEKRESRAVRPRVFIFSPKVCCGTLSLVSLAARTPPSRRVCGRVM